MFIFKLVTARQVKKELQIGSWCLSQMLAAVFAVKFPSDYV